MRHHWVALAAVAAMMGTSACADKEARRQIAEAQQQIKTMRKEIDDLTTWLGKSDQVQTPPSKTMYKWADNVKTAVCSLENRVKDIPGGTLPVEKRLCDENGDHGGVPKPPPFS